MQLSYIDQVAIAVSSADLIPAKVASGESDLQGAYLGFSNFTFLKEAEERSHFAGAAGRPPGAAARCALS